MIYTVTFNPSLDYIVRVDGFKPGIINRTTYENILPGGKGINVSIVLSNLGHKSVALGFMAGFTGDDIEELMKGFGCGVVLIRVRASMSSSNPAKRLLEDGARNVLISMAGEGAVFISENGEVFRSPAPKGVLVNSVGAGDSMVAGFISGYLETGDYREAFRMGIAAGSASAFSPNLATRPETEALLQAF